MTGARASLLFLAALPACVSGRDCAPAVPDAVRADAIRFALDRGLVLQKILPREDLALALGAGRPYAELGEAERTEISRWAAGYAACINERIDRD